MKSLWLVFCLVVVGGLVFHYFFFGLVGCVLWLGSGLGCVLVVQVTTSST